jgi:hypothetical protein
MEIPPQSVHSLNPVTSIMINDGAQLFNDWPLKPAQPIGSPRWLLGSKDCFAACKSPMPSCSAPP